MEGVTKDLPEPYKYAHWLCVMMKAKSMSYEDRLEASKQCLAEGKTIGIVNLFGLKEPLDSIGYKYRYDNTIAKVIRDTVPEVIIEKAEKLAETVEKVAEVYKPVQQVKELEEKEEERREIERKLEELKKYAESLLDFYLEKLPLILRERLEPKKQVVINKVMSEVEKDVEEYYENTFKVSDLVRKFLVPELYREFMNAFSELKSKIASYISKLKRAGIWEYVEQYISNMIKEEQEAEENIRKVQENPPNEIQAYISRWGIGEELYKVSRLEHKLKDLVDNIGFIKRMLEKMRKGEEATTDEVSKASMLLGDEFTKKLKRKKAIIKMLIPKEMALDLAYFNEQAPEIVFVFAPLEIHVYGIDSSKVAMFHALLDSGLIYESQNIEMVYNKAIPTEFWNEYKGMFRKTKNSNLELLFEIEGEDVNVYIDGELVGRSVIGESILKSIEYIEEKLFASSEILLNLSVFKLLTMADTVYIEDGYMLLGKDYTKIVIDKDTLPYDIEWNTMFGESTIFSGENLNIFMPQSIKRKKKLDRMITINFAKEQPIGVKIPVPYTIFFRIYLAPSDTVIKKPNVVSELIIDEGSCIGPDNIVSILENGDALIKLEEFGFGNAEIYLMTETRMDLFDISLQYSGLETGEYMIRKTWYYQDSKLLKEFAKLSRKLQILKEDNKITINGIFELEEPSKELKEGIESALKLFELNEVLSFDTNKVFDKVFVHGVIEGNRIVGTEVELYYKDKLVEKEISYEPIKYGAERSFDSYYVSVLKSCIRTCRGIRVTVLEKPILKIWCGRSRILSGLQEIAYEYSLA